MKVLNLLRQRSLHLIHILPFLCHEVAANTEIITFSSSREPTVDLFPDVVGNWSTLCPTDDGRWSVEPAALHTPLRQVCERTDAPPFSCPHELWFFLDLDDVTWASYAVFTLRLSWAASVPADFAISLYSPQDLSAYLAERELVTRARAPPHTLSTPRTPTTRSRYARIRAVHAGVLVPTPPHPHQPRTPVPILAPGHPSIDLEAPANIDITNQRSEETHPTVPFILILEPVHWGVLPASLLPTASFLVPIILAAAVLVPWVTAYLEPYARQAREDLETEVTRTDANKER